jgi:hypothetical protein
MTAICPAGPPKVCSEMANQVLVASDSGMTSPPLAALGGSGSGVMLVSRARHHAHGASVEMAGRTGGTELAPRSVRGRKQKD